MRSEEDIYNSIAYYEELARDHHILLNTPLVQQVIFAHYSTIISTLKWVLDEPEVACIHKNLEEVEQMKNGKILMKCTRCPHLFIIDELGVDPREPTPEDFQSFDTSTKSLEIQEAKKGGE